MTLHSDDLSRLEAASRLLASPLAAPDPEAWLLDAGVAVRDLLGGTGVALQFPTARTPYFSEDSAEMVEGVLGFIQEVTWDGTRFSDPSVDAWSRLRQEWHLETCSWDFNDAVVRERGFDFCKGPFCGDVLDRHHVADYVALMGAVPQGEAMVWVLHRQHGGFPFGEHTDAVLRALLPSFRAGLDTLGRLGAQRALLEAVGEPLAVFGPSGRPLYENAALATVLAEDPERSVVCDAVARLGRAGSRLDRGPRGDGPLPAEDRVYTRFGGYTLRRTLLPSGLFGTEPTVLVTVSAQQLPRLPCPERVRERLGLTAREAEVALLLAEGLSNAALADRLFIAPATARRHTESVLGKLGVPSRAAVASTLLAAA